VESLFVAAWLLLDEEDEEEALVASYNLL